MRLIKNDTTLLCNPKNLLNFSSGGLRRAVWGILAQHAWAMARMILYEARKICRAAETQLLTDGLQCGFGCFNHLARRIKRGLGL
ncbi:MAG: hypothetical protein ACO37E_11980, partial [Lutimaribacter sp.]